MVCKKSTHMDFLHNQIYSVSQTLDPSIICMRYLNISISQHICSSQLYFWSSTHTFCSWKIALSLQQLNSASRKIHVCPLPLCPQFSGRIQSLTILIKIHSLTHGASNCTTSYKVPGQCVTVLLTQGTRQIRYSGFMALKNNPMGKSGGRAHTPSG